MANFAHQVLIRFGFALGLRAMRHLSRRYHGDGKRNDPQGDTESGSVLQHGMMSPCVNSRSAVIYGSGPQGGGCNPTALQQVLAYSQGVIQLNPANGLAGE